MPLVTRMCPSDTYRVYKQGSKVRIDSTLMGFEEYTWSRGNTSVIFQANGMSFNTFFFSYFIIVYDNFFLQMILELLLNLTIIKEKYIMIVDHL